MNVGRIMVVEDEVIVAEDLRRGLSAAGYEVIAHAVDGREAITEALSLKPDVILMDVFLDGDIDGIAAARAIMSSIDVAIIYVSANAADALVDDAVRSGADGYIVKPFQLPQVMTAIKVALHQREARLAREEPGSLPQSAAPHAAERPQQSSRAAQADPSISAGPEHLSAVLHRLQGALVDDAVGRDREDDREAGTVITAREKEVIRGLLCYRRVSIVAQVLGISVHTARNHLKSIFRKLDLHSQDELMRFLIDGPGV